MPVTNEITLQMLLDEQKRIRKHMVEFYPHLVKERKLTPWERDHRLNCNQKLIDLIMTAISNKKTNGPKLLQILEQQP